MTAPQSRPRVVTAAFWCWLVASVMLMAGGLIAVSLDVPAIYRGAGAISLVAGAAMAFLTGQTRSDDIRYRRAAIALSLAIVVLVSLSAALGVGHILTLLAVLPLIAGAVLMTRPSASTQGEEQ